MNIIRSVIATAALALALPAFAQNQAVLSWSAPTQYADGTPITTILSYNVYQGLQGQAKVKVPALTTMNKTQTVTGLPSGTTVCWAVTAFIGSNESPQSAQACKTFAPSAIAAPTLTVE